MLPLLRSTRALLGFAALGLTAFPAQASFTASFVGSAPAGGSTAFTYNFVFTPTNAGESLNTGDFLTFYDIGPVTASLPAGLTFSQSLTGLTPVGVSPTDAANILNATFTYNGALGASVTTATTFANLTITSSVSTTQSGFYTSRDTIPNGSISTFGAVTLPSGAVAAAPEPASMALLAAAGSLLALTVCGRRKMFARRPRFSPR